MSVIAEVMQSRKLVETITGERLRLLTEELRDLARRHYLEGIGEAVEVHAVMQPGGGRMWLWVNRAGRGVRLSLNGRGRVEVERVI